MKTVVGIRLHSLMFSAGQGVPVVGMSYDIKVDGFLKYIGSRTCLQLSSVKAEPLYRLAVDLKSRGKHLMAYSGYTFEELMQLSDPYVKKLLGELDLLVDGRFLMEEKNIDLRFRGSANQRVIDVRRTQETGTVCLHENTDK